MNQEYRQCILAEEDMWNFKEEVAIGQYNIDATVRQVPMKRYSWKEDICRCDRIDEDAPMKVN